MYSQCPKCQAIFSVSETDIGAHHGLVRCGYCSSIFHAVTNEVADGQFPSGGEAPAETGSDESQLGQQDSARDAPPSGDAGARAHAGDEAPAVNGGSGPVVDEPPYSDVNVQAPLGDEAPEVVDQVESAPDEQLDTRALDTVDEAGDIGAAVNDERQPGDDPATVHPDADREDLAPVPEDRDQTDEKWIEAVLSGTGTADDQASGDTPALPGEITEEITIEAPPVLWNVSDEDLEADSEPGAPAGRGPEREDDAGAGDSAAGPASESQRARQATRAPRRAGSVSGAAPGRRTPLSSPYRARDVRMVELPQPRPFKTATLSLTAVLLGLLLVWQAKTYYLDELAQLPVLRPYLETLCRPLGCVLPPRSDFAQIDLVGTGIDVNAEIPGALEITASLINRAGFPQPYPPLRVTLSDREGRIVGRRTYLPSEYRQGEAEQDELLPAQEVRDVSIKLAQPAENAVGYEVELITPIESDD